MPKQEIVIGAIQIPSHILSSGKVKINFDITIEDIDRASAPGDSHCSARTPDSAHEGTASIIVKQSAQKSTVNSIFPPKVVFPDPFLASGAIQTPTPRQAPVSQLVQPVQPITRPSTRYRGQYSSSSFPVTSCQLVPVSTSSRRGAFSPSELSTVETAIREGKPASDIYPLFTYLSLPQFKMRYSRLKQKLQGRS